MIFFIIVSFVIAQRLVEVLIAKRNEKVLLAKGAFEVGASHYPYMILLHVTFFISLITEVLLLNRTLSPLFIYFVVLFGFVQLLRIWCLSSLATYWNTKIIVLPGANVIKKGPYIYIRHPNYLVVCIEILVLPIMFQAYFTALCFTILNIIMLSIRIPIEEKALREVTDYEKTFQNNITL